MQLRVVVEQFITRVNTQEKKMTESKNDCAKAERMHTAIIRGARAVSPLTAC